MGAVLWAAVPRHPSRDTLALPRVPALPEKSLSPFPSCLGFCIPRGRQLWVSPLIQPCSILCELSLGSFPSQHPPCPPLGLFAHPPERSSGGSLAQAPGSHPPPDRPPGLINSLPLAAQ